MDSLELFAGGILLVFVLWYIVRAKIRGYGQEDVHFSAYSKVSQRSPKKKNNLMSKNQNQELEEEKVRKVQGGEVVVQKYDPENDLALTEDQRVVGVVEPKGFWSRFIMAQKFQYIMQRMHIGKKGPGFWANLIKAQSASQGRDQSRGR